MPLAQLSNGKSEAVKYAEDVEKAGLLLTEIEKELADVAGRHARANVEDRENRGSGRTRPCRSGGRPAARVTAAR